jgi:hypothetical protein
LYNQSQADLIMKTSKLLLAGSLLVLATALSGFAQSYDLSWFTIDGGGGVSSGGGYTLAGTIGQPDAATLSGGPYTITGGFWSIIGGVTPPPGSPPLSVKVSGHNVIISWPSASTGFVVEQTTSLKPTAWSTAPQTVTDDGTTKSITVAAPTLRSTFYRLRY